MFNNVIYFIIVLLIFNISYPGSSQEKSLLYSLAMMFVCWVLFAGYCRIGFSGLMARYRAEQEGRFTHEYQGLVLRLSILAILLFSLDIYVFQLKYWIHLIPWLKSFSVMEGLLGLSLFMFYLCTIWYYAHPSYRRAFQAGIEKQSFIFSNLKLNLPTIFPWLALSLIYDLLAFSPWSGPGSILEKPEGQIIFFALFLGLLIVFMPPLIQYWWGCRPFDSSERIEEIKSFLRKLGFKYRNLLRWPIFEGRLMTAGIMGIVPRFRYILITESLLEYLSIKELQAVMAHEVGHAKYRHMLFYTLFFLGFMALSFGSFDIFFSLLATRPFFIETIRMGSPDRMNLFYLLLSIPILTTMFVYFRFLMGFFMRHFERQADLYSAVTMGSPVPAITALEKIALVSGKSRDLPSWHHFSIKERVEYLWKYLKEPDLVSRHNRFVRLSFISYILCIVGLAFILNFSPVKESINYRLVETLLTRDLKDKPDDSMLLQSLAMIYHETGRYEEAIETYEKTLDLDNVPALVFNNLAWILVTVENSRLNNPEKGLILAQKAVEMEKNPIYLDTLAEAYFVNGDASRAIEIIEEAISLEEKNSPYLMKQLKRFKTGG